MMDLQQEQIELIEKETKSMADELSQQGPALDNLQGMTATLESRGETSGPQRPGTGEQDNALIELLDARDAIIRNCRPRSRVCSHPCRPLHRH